MISMWTLWNLFLAFIPVPAAHGVANLARRVRVERSRLGLMGLIPVAGLWLAFLPNSCYLMTEWRHFLFEPHFQAIRGMTNPNDLSVLRVAKQAAFFALYSSFGLMCFALAVRPIVRALRCWGIHPAKLAVPFIVLVSLGVYLGLILRMNSWDLLLRPRHVFWFAARAILNPTLLAVILGYAGVLGLIYVFCDIWFDGFRLRLHRLGLSRSGRTIVRS